MTPAELRLEALKLAVRPGLELDSIIIAAELYYGFMMKGDAPRPTTPASAVTSVKAAKR